MRRYYSRTWLHMLGHTSADKKGTDLFSRPAPFLFDRKAPSFPAQTLAVKPFKRQKRKSPVSDDGAFAWLSGAGEGNHPRQPTN